MARDHNARPHLQPRSRVSDPDKFAEALHAAGYTYRSLADQFHIPRSTLNDYGTGQLGVSPAFAARLEEALKVTPGSLFTPTSSTTPDGAAPNSEHDQPPAREQT